MPINDNKFSVQTSLYHLPSLLLLLTFITSDVSVTAMIMFITDVIGQCVCIVPLQYHYSIFPVTLQLLIHVLLVFGTSHWSKGIHSYSILLGWNLQLCIIHKVSFTDLIVTQSKASEWSCLWPGNNTKVFHPVLSSPVFLHMSRENRIKSQGNLKLCINIQSVICQSKLLSLSEVSTSIFDIDMFLPLHSSISLHLWAHHHLTSTFLKFHSLAFTIVYYIFSNVLCLCTHE